MAQRTTIQQAPLELDREFEVNNTSSTYRVIKDEKQVKEKKAVRKSSQYVATLKWVNENYKLSEGVSLPRCTLYQHYLDFCQKQCFNPIGPAAFGKIIRQQFPGITTRRLGARGQSKYHYYGIDVTPTSVYYKDVLKDTGMTRFSEKRFKSTELFQTISSSSKRCTLPRGVLKVQDLKLPVDVKQDKMETFLIMYHTHCQQIIDIVISARFLQVQHFLNHFWLGIPDHLQEILDKSVLRTVVAVYDGELYKTIEEVLIPSSISAFPESLQEEILNFVKSMDVWLNEALHAVPESLFITKLEVFHEFLGTMKRQLCFIHLSQSTSLVLANQEQVHQMIKDLENISMDNITIESMFLCENPDVHLKNRIKEGFQQVLYLLKKQANIEEFTELVDGIIKELFGKQRKEDCFLTTMEKDIFLLWFFTIFLILRELTLQKASSFGYFQLLCVTLEEYILLVMDTFHRQQQNDKRLQQLLVFASNYDDFKKKFPSAFNYRKQEENVQATKPQTLSQNTHNLTSDSMDNASKIEEGSLTYFQSAETLAFQEDELHSISVLFKPLSSFGSYNATEL
ncbi:transcription factor RFX4-like isoform X2 [Tachypleus tridentatus]|uniref:transcription factor RFX4-like isoform X2 n=1 Tax=Tachypleus tridentatus TaxID=6853 RepID=UPI003FD659C8